MNDYEKRALGHQAQLALQAIDVALNARVEEALATAEAYRGAELTPEIAHLLLVRVVEARQLRQALAGQVEEGMRAARRTHVAEQTKSLDAARERAAETHGRNRFMPRTKVPPPEKPAA